jgi:hypothetical protein
MQLAKDARQQNQRIRESREGPSTFFRNSAIHIYGVSSSREAVTHYIAMRCCSNPDAEWLTGQFATELLDAAYGKKVGPLLPDIVTNFVVRRRRRMHASCRNPASN